MFSGVFSILPRCGEMKTNHGCQLRSLFMGSDVNIDAYMCFPTAKSEHGNVTIASETTDKLARDRVEKANAAYFEIDSFDWGANATGTVSKKKKKKHKQDDDDDDDDDADLGGMKVLGARSIVVQQFSI